MKKFCACILSFLALSALAEWDNEVKVAAGMTETIDLGDTTRNTRNYYFTLAKGATLKVTNDSSVSKNMLFSVAVDEAAGGSAYLDLTNVPGVQYAGNIKATGADVSLVVIGVSSLPFGSTATPSATASGRTHALFAGVLGFETAGGAGLQFVNYFGLNNLPSCPYTVAEDAEMGLMAPFVFGNEPSTVNLGTKNMLCAVSRGLAPGSTVEVPAGQWYKVRSCTYGKPNGWSWGGAVNVSISNNVVLCGSGAKLVNVNTQDGVALVGTVSGTGDLVVEKNASYLMLDGELSFAGQVTFLSYTSSTELYTTHTSFGQPANEVAVNRPATIALGVARGEKDVKPSGEIGALTVSAANAKLVVQNGQTATIGTLATSADGFCVEAAAGAANTKVVVNELAANAKLTVGPGVELVVGTAGAGHAILFEGDTVRFSGPAAGDRVALADYNWDAPDATKFIAGGKLDLGSPSADFPSVTIAADADVALQGGLDFVLANAGGKVTLTDNTWQKKCYLWTDATKTSSCEFYTGSESAVVRWNDRRPGQQKIGFFNHRNDDSVCPTLAAKGLNKKSVMNLRGGNKWMALVDRTVATPGVTNVATSLAIAVYGSETASSNAGGGGFAPFGNADKAFQRDAAQTSAGGTDVITKYPITAAAYTGYLDGAAVSDFSQEHFNGTWQLLTLNTVLTNVAQTVQGIGLRSNATSTTPDGRGGQKYAEVLLFSDMPTDDERKRIEKYLADKWGLTIAHAGAAATGTATGIAGAGEVVVESDNVIPALSHAFSGTLKFVNPLTEETTADLTVGNAGTDVTVTGFHYDAVQEAYVIDVALADKKVAAGDYALLSGFPDGTRFVLGTVANPHGLAYALKSDGGAASLEISRKGLILTVR